MPGSIHETLKNVDDKIVGVLDAQQWTYGGQPLVISCTGSEGQPSVTNHLGYLDSIQLTV